MLAELSYPCRTIIGTSPWVLGVMWGNLEPRTTWAIGQDDLPNKYLVTETHSGELISEKSFIENHRLNSCIEVISQGRHIAMVSNSHIDA